MYQVAKKYSILLILSAFPALSMAHAQQPKLLTLSQLTTKSLSDMAKVSAGSYKMGPSDKRFMTSNNTPAHKVKLRGFYISKYNVSYGKYDSYTVSAKKPFIQKQYMQIWNKFRDAQHPVDHINWHQANVYCAYLAKKTGLPYSLPTEAQWEYVARNNGQPDWDFSTNNGKQEPGKNYPSVKMLTVEGGFFPMPVGSLPCTPQGICGLNGQVNQWVKDWYAPHYYAHSPISDPQGPKTGTEKVNRGGSAQDSPGYNNVYNRYADKPSSNEAGFRCVINSTLPKSRLLKIALKNIK